MTFGYLLLNDGPSDSVSPPNVKAAADPPSRC